MDRLRLRVRGVDDATIMALVKRGGVRVIYDGLGVRKGRADHIIWLNDHLPLGTIPIDSRPGEAGSPKELVRVARVSVSERSGRRRTRMNAAPIFLSASVPNRDLQTYVPDPVAIREAVRALVGITLAVPGRLLIFGGHPAISPMVWEDADSLGAVRPDLYLPVRALQAGRAAAGALLRGPEPPGLDAGCPRPGQADRAR